MSSGYVCFASVGSNMTHRKLDAPMSFSELQNLDTQSDSAASIWLTKKDDGKTVSTAPLSSLGLSPTAAARPLSHRRR